MEHWGAKGFNEMAKAMSKIKAADVAAERMNNLKGKIEELSKRPKLISEMH